eukprot:c17751_g1_i2.p1 GENE.c17751_g1_i2~~c17751_g1_i2.p1  ORF type:complete len:384 (-),score=110.99 c17751_g1_i2:85-1236(-)
MSQESILAEAEDSVNEHDSNTHNANSLESEASKTQLEVPEQSEALDHSKQQNSEENSRNILSVETAANWANSFSQLISSATGTVVQKIRSSSQSQNEPVRRSRWVRLVAELRSSSRTFEPPRPDEITDFEIFCSTYDPLEYFDAQQHALTESPELVDMYDKLVPDSISQFVFWQRYFFRLQLLEQAEARKRAQLMATTPPILTPPTQPMQPDSNHSSQQQQTAENLESEQDSWGWDDASTGELSESQQQFQNPEHSTSRNPSPSGNILEEQPRPKPPVSNTSSEWEVLTDNQTLVVSSVNNSTTTSVNNNSPPPLSIMHGSDLNPILEATPVPSASRANNQILDAEEEGPKLTVAPALNAGEVSIHKNFATTDEKDDDWGAWE